LTSDGESTGFPSTAGRVTLVPNPRSEDSASGVVAVGLVAENKLLAEALGDALDRRPDLHVVIAEGRFDDFVARVDTVEPKPSVLLLEHSCAEPYAATERLHACAPSARILVTSVPLELSAVLEWTEAGAQGLLSEDAGLDVLASGILLVATGQVATSPPVTALLMESVRASRSGAALASDMQPLTRREYEVAGLIERGLSNKEIARQLNITVSTVKNHVHSILTKLELGNRGRVRHSRAGHKG